MRHRVTVQRPTETLNTYGEPIVTWTDQFTDEPASLELKSGNETIRGRQVESKVSVIFTVRYRAGYTTSMKVVHDGVSYGIVYINPVMGGRRYIELYCCAAGDL
jgi:SPP1 family predicted phage head-tail adaptor